MADREAYRKPDWQVACRVGQGWIQVGGAWKRGDGQVYVRLDKWARLRGASPENLVLFPFEPSPKPGPRRRP